MAFSTFKSQLSGQRKRLNGAEIFHGSISDNLNGQPSQETLLVTIRLTTNEYGQVSMDEGNILFSEIVHMDFNSD